MVKAIATQTAIVWMISQEWEVLLTLVCATDPPTVTGVDRFETLVESVRDVQVATDDVVACETDSVEVEVGLEIDGIVDCKAAVPSGAALACW